MMKAKCRMKKMSCSRVELLAGILHSAFYVLHF